LVQRLAPADPVLQVLLQERPWIDVLLFNQAGLGAQLTTSNLKAYINSGRYADTFIHRSMPGFVIQGGGYTWADPVEPEVATNLRPVAANAPVRNEYASQRANIRGTVAMAKLGNAPNSATSQWFFNLADNVTNLDRQNGGFTVFGRVQSADDLLLMDLLAAVDVYSIRDSALFTDIPLLLDPGASVVSPPNTLRFSDVELHDRPELTYTVTTSSPLLEASVQDQRLLLRLHPSAKPSAETVVVRVVATNLLGESVQQAFQVQLPMSSPALVSSAGDVLLVEAASEGELQNPEAIKGSGWSDVITLNAPRSLTFRAVAHERWGAGYVARNAATGQFLPLLGLGRYSFVAQNISPEGSSLSIELDESSPSALFLHDAHSAFHAQLADHFVVDSDGRESMARLETIDAIVMGGSIGTSIVDLTSADYSLDAVAVHGGSRSGSRSVIWCGDGNDTVIGHGADLVIFGGDGANAYQLSGGQDVLQFAADGHSNDRVASFEPGSDRIEIWNAQALQDPISFTSQADGLLLKWGNSSLLLEGLTSATFEDLVIRYHD
jgi:cyclophilin family peptidyl-prolyl cis-trans isomerase